MKIKITLYCPDCRSAKIIKNGNKSNHKQNYRCTDCVRQFTGNHALTCKGCHSELSQKILRMLFRGVGIRDIAEIEQASGEIVAHVWGKRNVRTTKMLRRKTAELGVTFDVVCTDNWVSFKDAFGGDNHVVGKAHTVGIEGNNCRLRHRVRRAFRRTCCFSKKPTNHPKTFYLAFFYFNYGYA